MVRDIWFAIPATVSWLIWKGRNDLLFNQVQPECERLSLLACPIQKINLIRHINTSTCPSPAKIVNGDTKPDQGMF